MKIVSVDKCTVSNGDVDFSPITNLGDVTFYDVLTPEEFKAAAREAEALLVNKAEVNADLLAACKNLKYVGTYSTGYNNVDIPACKARGIVVSNVPNYSTDAVSQHVFALLLNFVGSIGSYTSSVSRGDWIKSPTFCYMPYPMHELAGKTFGVYGYGNIGKATAKIAQAFGMHVLVCTRTKPIDCPYEVVGKDEIFARSDYLSLHCPLNADSQNLVNESTLSLMKSSAILINTARGGLVDEGALANALNAGQIGGACLDVLTKEPMRADNPLFGAKNVLFTPHVAWAPQETRQRLVDRVAENLSAYISGKPINNLTK
jgi:glycerate dehydrogenase